MTPDIYLSDTNVVFFHEIIFDGLQLKGRQDKWLLAFQQQTGSTVIPKGNALKRPLLQQLQVLWLQEVWRRLAKFGFMLHICDPSVATAKEPYPPKAGKSRAKAGVRSLFLFDVPVSMSLFCRS